MHLLQSPIIFGYVSDLVVDISGKLRQLLIRAGVNFAYTKAIIFDLILRDMTFRQQKLFMKDLLFMEST